MTQATLWFLVIAATAIAAPYLLGVKPRTRRQWFYVAVTLGFLAWILPFMASLRAQSTEAPTSPLAVSNAFPRVLAVDSPTSLDARQAP